MAENRNGGTRNEGTQTLETLGRHLLMDGFQCVIDLKRSSGSRLYDLRGGRFILDLYSFYASMPIGFNHPHFSRPDVREELAVAAATKVANSDMYSPQMARFVETFFRVMGVPDLPRLFFVEGGALAVENALKAAMDWKVQKNLAAGRGEIGVEVVHFRNCFHGRTGYTMSLTNTDPVKTRYYAKFDWPRITSPVLDPELNEVDRTAKAVADERQAEAELLEVLDSRPNRACCVIIEPIQCEGGDHHFRGDWLRTLRRICSERDVLLVFDEVQTGMGVTGRPWCCRHFDVVPDLLCFGKKAQVCGVMAGPRLDEVPGNVFRTPSRINSTWGGNFTDMVRSTHFLNIIEKENLIDNAAMMGRRFLEELSRLAGEEPLIRGVRGRGLLLGFSLPDTDTRNRLWRACFDAGLLVLRCGERSIRLRPYMDVTPDVMEEAMTLLRDAARTLRK